MLKIENGRLNHSEVVDTSVLFSLMQTLGFDSTSKAEKAYIREEIEKELDGLEGVIQFMREGLEVNIYLLPL